MNIEEFVFEVEETWNESALEEVSSRVIGWIKGLNEFRRGECSVHQYIGTNVEMTLENKRSHELPYD